MLFSSVSCIFTVCNQQINMNDKIEITEIHPGLILKQEVLEKRNLTTGQGAIMLDISRLTLSKITNGKGSITPNIALRVEAVFGDQAQGWLDKQRDYDLALERIKFKANPPNIKQYK